MTSTVRVDIGENTEIVVRGTVPKTLSAFMNFLGTSVASGLTLNHVLRDSLRRGVIRLGESKPASLYVARDALGAFRDLIMLTIETKEKTGAAIFPLPLVPSDSIVAGDWDDTGDLTFDEKYPPQSLIPPCQMFIPATGSPVIVSGWIEVSKKSGEWQRYALSRAPIPNAMGVGAVVNGVAAIFGAPLQGVPGSAKAGRGTCIISPPDSDLLWFFFASGKVTDESVRAANSLARDVEKEIILHDPSQNLIWDLTGQKNPQPTQLPNIQAFALFIPSVEIDHTQKQQLSQ